MVRIIFDMFDDRRQKIFEETGGCDFAHVVDVDGVNWRFRVNVLQQLGHVGMVARRVNNLIPDFAGLNLPPIMEELCKFDQGMVLLAGVTGSGKSTTIALDAQLHQPQLPQAHSDAGRPDRIHVHRRKMPD